MKLLNGGVVNHYWPITPTFQILFITDPDLAHFMLNLRSVFESFDILRLTSSRRHLFENFKQSISSKKSRFFKRTFWWGSERIFTWTAL